MAKSTIFEIPAGAYVYCVRVDGVRRYVGKGRRTRALEHLGYARRINEARARGEKVRTSKFYNKLARALREGAAIEIECLRAGLTDEEAYSLEAEVIAADATGQLWNLLPGGLGGDSEFFRQFWLDPENRAAASRRSRELWGDPAFREREVAKLRERTSTDEFRRMRSDEMKARFDRPEYREAQGALTRLRWQENRELLTEQLQAGRERAKEKFSAATKALWADPEYRARMCAAQQARWTPEARKASSDRMNAKYASDQTGVRERIAASVKDLWADPAYREAALAARRKKR